MRGATDGTRGGWLFARWAGMGWFTLIWSGQMVSLVGNSTLRFAFVIETWTRGERATAVAMLSVCALLPQVLLSPVAGAIVDRYRKRTALQLADAGGLVVVAVLSIAHFTGDLQPWQIYPAVMLLGGCAAFQFPAMASAVPMLVRREQLQRANGLLASAKSVAEVCGPALGGAMLAFAGIGVILGVDLVTFAFALVTIRLARLHGDSVGGDRPRGGRWKGLAADSVAGLRYLFARPSLRDLMLVFFSVNLVMVFGFAAVQPMVLSRTGNDVAALASVNTAIGIGGVAGGLLLAIWGGPKNRVRGMLLGVIGMCLSAQVAMAVSREVVAWCAAILIGALLMPMVNAAMQSVVQTKVPREWHGRVFGAVMFGSQISAPLAMAISGPLADYVFEPQRASGTGLAGLLAPAVGAGPGAGMAAMLLLAGVGGIAVALWGMARRTVRHLDQRLPDQPPAGVDAPAEVDTGADVDVTDNTR